MSQENNLETSHLCTTEDAFEKFQSVAMYEEDEFFTLSDIVSPKPAVPDLSNELNEIPYDNEVVLSSAENGNAQQLSCTVESTRGQDNEPGTQIIDISGNNASDQRLSTSGQSYSVGTFGKPKRLTKKKGRKKTNSRAKTLNCQNDNVNVHVNEFHLESENNAFADSQAIQDSVLSTTVGKNGTESKTDTLQTSKYPRRTKRERILNTSKYPTTSGSVHNDASPSKNPRKRRGRPKKSFENQTISEPDSTNIDDTSVINENISSMECGETDEYSNKSTFQKGRRGRPRTSLVQTYMEETNLNESTINIPESDVDVSAHTKKLTKRGRKRLNKVTEKLSDSVVDTQLPNEGSNVQSAATDLQLEENNLSVNESVNEDLQSHYDVDVESLINTLDKPSGKQGKKRKVIAKPIASTNENLQDSLQKVDDIELDTDEDADDICLSKLKKNINNITENLDISDDIQNTTENLDISDDIQNTTENGETSAKRNSKVPLMADFEYNIDKIVKEASIDGQIKPEDSKECLLVEDTSKRPYRRKTKKIFKYDEDSEEDPFANVELSEDDEPKSKKKGRYDYDHEYIPGKKKGSIPVTSSDTDSELNEELGEGRKTKRKKVFKNIDSQSPRKRGRKKKSSNEITDINPEVNESQEGNMTESLQPSLTQSGEDKLSMKPPAEAWATSNEFENFIAQKIQGTNLKIKKVSSKLKSENIVTPLEIPVVDQNEPKKVIEIFTQTNSTPTTSTGVQTSVPYDIPMKSNITLSSEQSHKACEFLNSVVKTTVELGQLMKDKSEDFMKKKINPDSVTDTFKMDYCVRKSFLLFKLAKHNLMQMEQDLAKQYDEFLRKNNLSSCREEIKNVTAKPKVESDSDCEIVDVEEVPGTSKIKEKEKPKFNPKTVFLNKELSIKMAKKPSFDKNIDIKGRHTVWINDSVMVKKVKPTQSFLAQDSRNKKPPDYVTEKMVSDFFEDYYRQKALSVCAPYINTEWCSVHKEYACHYFVKCDDFDVPNANDTEITMNNNASTSNGIVDTKETYINNPKSLSILCAEVVHKCLHVDSNDNMKETIQDLKCRLTDGKSKHQPLTLFRLCIKILSPVLQNGMSIQPSLLSNPEDKKTLTVLPLKTLCYKRIAGLMHSVQELSDNWYEDINGHFREDNFRDSYDLTDEDDVSNHWQEPDILSDTNSYSSKQIDNEDVFQNANVLHSGVKENSMKSLLILCLKSIQSNMYADCNRSMTTLMNDIKNLNKNIQIEEVYPIINSPRSLKWIVYRIIRHLMYEGKFTDYFNVDASITDIDAVVPSNDNSEDFTINCINTMTEEAFHSLNESHEDQDNDEYDYEPDITHFDEDTEANENEWASQVQMQVLSSCVTSPNNIPANEYNNRNIDNNGVTPVIQTTEYEFGDTNIENEDPYQDNLESADVNPLLAAQVKLEPLDEDAENVVDSSIVKTEPVHGLDGMTIIPESVVTKSEMIENVIEAAELSETQSPTYDVNTFEQFVNTNKMMQSMGEYSDDEEIFSQSGLRIRRQHEPDYDAENDMNMSLLIPQTSEPLLLENAKGILMESSSDESKVDGLSKKGNKKKVERKKAKQKKGKENAKNTSKETPTMVPEIPSPVKEVSVPAKEKSRSINEVAMLTRRMREKIRQEEKKIESSGSETENQSCSLKKDKSKKECEKNKSTKNTKQGESSKVEDEIQCNNVDSTEQILENKNKIGEKDQFTGFSAIDQNEMSSYQKYMQFVYDKIIPGDEDSPEQESALTDLQANLDSNRSSSPVINPDHPVEILECEPTMPIFDNNTQEKGVKRSRRVSKKNKLLAIAPQTSLETVEEKLKESEKNEEPEPAKFKTSEKIEQPEQSKSKKSEITENPEPIKPNKSDKIEEPEKIKPKNNKIEVLEKEKLPFEECNGWHLYSINSTDAKLYQNCLIPLEKLPESFVDTYLEYHDITDRDNEDKEIDRLANLQSLIRGTGIKEVKTKGRPKQKALSNEQSSDQNSRNDTRSTSPPHSDHYDELTPSEDEGANVALDELPPPVPIRTTENHFAKDSLMKEHESDSLMKEHESDSDEGGTKKIKQEPIDYDQVEVKRKPGPKSKTQIVNKPKVNASISPENKAKVDIKPLSESLMLTADKMMNKELSLLYAPVNLKEEVKETPVKEPSPKEGHRLRRRQAKSLSLRDLIKTEDDSSSEEEKQWVSTKEKLLKRMGKKGDTSVDDAKRAKLVDDFIERRGDAPGKRRPHVGGSRKSRKKFLERLKQQRFLSKELFGESSSDLAPGSKRGAAPGLFKGRRNIRKVIDKKSLQKSTVVANMEEFERKRRLNARQSQLRELLGCEEGVNVLVINDEVCLEYDFQEQRPVVTVHPFFTKVMKAHQYEGVKFMWDACFESLQSIETGRGGGGCILAHCMGLGKTLQVLALLHTVLTHPRVGMQRVLVCCPLSTVLNWVDEIHKWIGPVTDQIKVFELSKLKKTYERAYQLEDWYSGGGIFIIGYELFRSLTTLDPLIDEVRPTIINKIRTALLDPGPDIVICDEGHLLKNDCSVLAVAMSRVVTKRRIILTGTPMQNNLREYYCMVNFVKPNLLGTYSEYSNRFENPIMNGQHRDSREEDIKLMKARTHILHKVLEGCLQRQEASVLYPYLPKKHEYTVFIPLTKCQWDLYKHYVHHYTKKSKQSVLKDFHILQKIWSHPQVLHNFQIKAREDVKKKDIKPEKVEDDLALEDKEDIKPADTEVWWLQYLADGAMLDKLECSNKFVAVFRILHECITLGDKVLIFSTSLFCLDALEYFLKQINSWSLGQEYYRLDGSVPAEVRQKWCREFNAENNLKTKLFLISTRAGCLGLNMTAANRVIILDTSWNPAHDIQSIFRVYRFGQKKDCYIYRLVAMGTMEQKIYERSVTKQAVACRVVDEQQIDRHYNMAELTELYRFDELGVGVAGGVAVGVGDVALLRVARDAAVHAVHEHDSLLRGSGEQGLPEHERAAAWMQFQQEHTHKQMQNDLESHQAARALQMLQEQQLMHAQLLQHQQQLVQQPQILNIKTEDGPVHENLLIPRPEQPPLRGRGALRGRGRKVVQCRIPIKSNQGEPSTSREQAGLGEAEMVQQISDILIKHNFTQSGKGPKQIKELVAKVKRMIQTGEPMSFGGDDLSASIASVLLQQKANATPLPTLLPPMPALTDVEEPKRPRGRPRKSTQNEPIPAPTPPPPVIPPEEDTIGGRRRRKAALAAERQFDILEDATSQDSLAPESVIELDDDDWHGGLSDTDSANEIFPDTKPDLTQIPLTTKPQKEKRKKRKVIEVPKKAVDSSIVLSDDEPLLAANLPPPPPQVEEQLIPLHPSLLTNQNFIKIVAHTYLAGNPMMDEDAATLAAQYSTFKLKNETESSGKPIVSGPIYDIAIKVLGEQVLRKLQSVDTPKSKERDETSSASSTLMQMLGQKPEPARQARPAAKKKPGPKSRIKQTMEETKEMPKLGIPPPVLSNTNIGGIVPVTLVKLGTSSTSVPPQTSTSQMSDECILPDDDDDVRCITDPSPPAPPAPPAPPRRLVNPIKIKLRLPAKKDQDVKPTLQSLAGTLRVTAGNSTPLGAGPAPRAAKQFATISLDSDEEEPLVAPSPGPPPSARAQRAARLRAALQYPSTAAGPVPVALTGPDSQPIPLAPPVPPHPSYYTFSGGDLRTVPTSIASTPTYPDPVPISLTGPDSHSVPLSFTGPDSGPVPISLTGPGFQGVPISLDGSGSQPVPTSQSYGGETIGVSYGGGVQSYPMTFSIPSSGAGVQPVAMTYVGGGSQPMSTGTSSFPGAVRAVRLGTPSGQPAPQPGTVAHQVASNIYLVPAGAPGERLLTRVPASAVPQTLQAKASLPTPSPPAPSPTLNVKPSGPSTSSARAVCKPGDILRLTTAGQLQLQHKDAADVVHTIIDDDEPVAKSPTPVPTKTNMPTTTAPKANAPLKPAPPQKPTPKSPNEKALPKQTLSKPKLDKVEIRSRKISSSSSSSDSSRSLSPDPLSILKDVVHIQAPERRKNSTVSSSKSESTSKQTSATNQSNIKSGTKSSKPTTSSNDKDKRKEDVNSQKLNTILASVKAKNTSVGSSKIAPAKPASNMQKSNVSGKPLPKIKDSIDLTEITVKSARPGVSNPEALKPGVSKPGMTKVTEVGKSTTASKKDGPTTVVGTSKNIVLDVKSKSLTNTSTVDLTGQKSIQVTNVKTIPPSSNKPKRPAPPPETAAPKKKKTELMTLKDFDIDDIDDIIELD